MESNVTVAYGNTVILSEIEPFLPPGEERNASEGSGRLEGEGTPRGRVHLDRVDPLLETLVEKSDVVVLNTGHHWNS